MKFGDLLRSYRQLEISIIVGDTEALSLPVTAGYITDLPDPSRFLTEGTLVMTSGLWAERPDGINRFTDALERSGARILVVGLIELGHVPDSLIDACRARGIVLATITERVSFGSILDAIREGVAVVDSVHSLQEKVTSAIAGGGLLEAVAVMTEEIGLTCWVVDTDGRAIAAHEMWPPSRPLDCYVAGLSSATAERPVALSVSPPAVALRVDAGSPGVAGILVIEADVSSIDDDTRRAIQAAGEAIAAEVRLLAEPGMIEHEHVAALLSSASDESAPPGELFALMRIAGLGARRSLRVVIAEMSDPLVPSRVVGTLVESILGGASALRARGDRALIGALGSRAVVVIASSKTDDEDVRKRIAEALPKHAELLGGRSMRIALSDSFVRMSDLGHAIAVTGERLDDIVSGERIAVADSGTATSHRTLLRAVGVKKRSTFSSAVLDPLIDYDAKHMTDLVETVRVFLDSGASWQEASKALHIHPNTLRYRVARIEELTHRDLSTMRDRVDLYLALTARDI